LKLLAFSDLHRNRNKARRVTEMAAEADVVIGAGDFASFRLGLDRTIAQLRLIDKPTLLVPGNNESEAALRRACTDWPSARVLHGEGTTIDGIEFFGLGAAVPPTPFPWSFDIDEETAAAKLASCPEDAVLIVHSPPKGYLDEAFGRHLGSEAILRAIETKRPRLAVCGHIHQCWAQEAEIARTRVVNLGPDGRFFDLVAT
jgi:Icc-related predicted phosphoesterase